MTHVNWSLHKRISALLAVTVIAGAACAPEAATPNSGPKISSDVTYRETIKLSPGLYEPRLAIYRDEREDTTCYIVIGTGGNSTLSTAISCLREPGNRNVHQE